LHLDINASDAVLVVLQQLNQHNAEYSSHLKRMVECGMDTLVVFFLQFKSEGALNFFA